MTVHLQSGVWLDTVFSSRDTVRGGEGMSRGCKSADPVRFVFVPIGACERKTMTVIPGQACRHWPHNCSSLIPSCILSPCATHRLGEASVNIAMFSNADHQHHQHHRFRPAPPQQQQQQHPDVQPQQQQHRNRNINRSSSDDHDRPPPPRLTQAAASRTIRVRRN